MAETATVETPADAEGKGGMKKMLVIGLVLGIAAAGGYFALLKPAPAEDAAAVEEVGDDLAPEFGEVREVATLTVNLDATELRYARVQFGIVMAPEALLDPTPWFPLLQDKAISTIAEFTPDELRTTAGHQRLRDALTLNAVEVWPGGEVLRVVLYDLIVQ